MAWIILAIIYLIWVAVYVAVAKSREMHIMDIIDSVLMGTVLVILLLGVTGFIITVVKNTFIQFWIEAVLYTILALKYLAIAKILSILVRVIKYVTDKLAKRNVIRAALRADSELENRIYACGELFNYFIEAANTLNDNLQLTWLDREHECSTYAFEKIKEKDLIEIGRSIKIADIKNKEVLISEILQVLNYADDIHKNVERIANELSNKDKCSEASYETYIEKVYELCEIDKDTVKEYKMLGIKFKHTNIDTGEIEKHIVYLDRAELEAVFEYYNKVKGR